MGIDFCELFAQVTRYATVRTVKEISVKMGYHGKLLNVKMIFSTGSCRRRPTKINQTGFMLNEKSIAFQDLGRHCMEQSSRRMSEIFVSIKPVISLTNPENIFRNILSRGP